MLEPNINLLPKDLQSKEQFKSAPSKFETEPVIRESAPAPVLKEKEKKLAIGKFEKKVSVKNFIFNHYFCQGLLAVQRAGSGNSKNFSRPVKLAVIRQIQSFGKSGTCPRVIGAGNGRQSPGRFG